MSNTPHPGWTVGEQVSFWRGDGPDGVEYLKARYKDFVFAPHSHDRYMIGLIVGGAIEVVEPKRSAMASRGHLVLCNVDQVHWGHGVCDDGWRIFAAYAPPRLLDETAREAGAAPRSRASGTIGFSHIAVEDGVLASRFVDLIEHCGVGDDRATGQDTLAQESLLLEILTRGFALHSDRLIRTQKPPSEPRAVTTARDYLESRYADAISLDALANRCGISRYWLIKAFKAKWGIAPYRYLTNVRVRRAIALLRDGAPPADVALQCGFADQSHLTRTFKRSLGMTPGRFRAA